MYDGNLVLQASTTKTASFNGTGLNLLTTPPVPRRGMKAKVLYSAASCAAAAKTISGAATDGGTGIRITSTAHGLNVGDVVFISGVGGVTNANGYWVIGAKATDTFDLLGSTLGGQTYTSGGTAWAFARATFSVDQSPDNTNWYPHAFQIENGVGGRQLGPSGAAATAATSPATGLGPAGIFPETVVGGSGTDIAVQGILLPPIANSSGLAAAGGEVHISIDPLYPYIRLDVTIVGGGGSPTITYVGKLGVAWP